MSRRGPSGGRRRPVLADAWKGEAPHAKTDCDHADLLEVGSPFPHAALSFRHDRDSGCRRKGAHSHNCPDRKPRQTLPGLAVPSPTNRAGGDGNWAPKLMVSDRNLGRRDLALAFSRSTCWTSLAKVCSPSASSSQGRCEAHCKSRHCPQAGRTCRGTLRSPDVPWPKRRFA